jgi:uncharacterized membrane-anchored protein
MAGLMFWLAKVCAGALGESGREAAGSMSVFSLQAQVVGGLLLVALAAQFAVKRYIPPIYWLVMALMAAAAGVASSALFPVFSGQLTLIMALRCIALVAALGAWRLTTGAVHVDQILTRADEAFYWLAVLLATALGAALGGYITDANGLALPLQTGAVLLGGLIVLVSALNWFRLLPRKLCFWIAFVLTGPLSLALAAALKTLCRSPATPIEAAGVAAGVLLAAILLWPPLRRPAAAG